MQEVRRIKSINLNIPSHVPSSWQEKLLLDGALEGAEIGWLIVLLSFPYNVICALLGIRGTRRLAQRLYPAPDAARMATPPAEAGRAEGTDSALNDAKDTNDAPDAAASEKLP